MIAHAFFSAMQLAFSDMGKLPNQNGGIICETLLFLYVKYYFCSLIVIIQGCSLPFNHSIICNYFANDQRTIASDTDFTAGRIYR
jgi:hypothetical protein